MKTKQGVVQSLVPSGAIRVFTVGVALCAACSREPETPAPSQTPLVLPSEIVIPAPSTPATDMERVEDWTEAIANTLFDYSDKLRRRDFAAAKEWLAPNFVGQAWDRMPVAQTSDLPLATHKTSFDVSHKTIVDRQGFLESLAAEIAPWRRVEFVLWKVKGAEFESQAPLSGKIRFKINFLGTAAHGGPRSMVAWANARVVMLDHQWKIERFELTSLDRIERSTTLFTDVSVPTGVAHSSPRFGQPGASTYAWNGAACADVDGDGAFDLFVPSSPRNFLYLSRAAGGFDERAVERGLAAPPGGTGCVFFDFDNDSDQDLAVCDVGWRQENGSIGGNRLRLYVNDGQGKFAERGVELGFEAVCHGYSMSVFDYDGDGWLDVYIANYGRIDVLPNDSWYDARNGSPDLLLRNLEGRRFEDVTKSVGLGDQRWSYASAAADFDGDGDQDLYVANDYGTNSLWRNDGGQFTDIAASAMVDDLGNGMGATWGDLDNDGRLDLYVANMSSTAGNRILGRLAGDETARAALLKMAAGNSVFLSRASETGITFARQPAKLGGVDANWAWSAALADFDLDGRLDVFCANGFITGETPADT